jgi:predicted oxidoreductase
VSNCRPTLLTALRCACAMPLIVQQVEISLMQRAPFTDGTLDQCLIEHITPLAWSPLAGGLLGDGAKRLLKGQEGYRVEPTVATLEAIAKAHGTTRMVIALAWLLQHSSKIVPIVGSANPERIREAVRATEIELTREEWYRLLLAARGEPLA